MAEVFYGILPSPRSAHGSAHSHRSPSCTVRPVARRWARPRSRPPSLRATGSRECAPDDRLREAILFRHINNYGLLRRFAPRNDGDRHHAAVRASVNDAIAATLRRSTKENKMDLGLKGRNAVVLGGTRGIGRAIADTLAGEGANVAICARHADVIASTVTELKAKGVK